ncbi:DEAD/DEAH box helicase family protein [Agrobacterium tumefaciens]|uniref:DEAD/DEAH box helicase family protein n=1 Tax=Agrobacterium tumefaciens TaxID=358 RepID=UPI00117843EB
MVVTELVDTLEAIEAAEPILFVPGDDLLSLLTTAIAASSSLDCMMGFFSSASLAEIAPGLASFLRSSDKPMRLVISPFVSAKDQQALKDGLVTAELLGERHFLEALPGSDDLAKHTLACLAWMIREERLELKIAIQRDGLFHPKIWLLSIDGKRLLFHGSSNLTGGGLRRNKEQIAISRAWIDGNQDKSEKRVRREFDRVWHNEDPDCAVFPLPAAIELQILRDYGGDTMPVESEAQRLWSLVNKPPPPESPPPAAAKPPVGFHIPSWLVYDSGPFSHQGEAVDAWLAVSGRGILAMATGSGKTLTSLIACHRLFEELGKLMIVVAAPYVPLVMQWCEEISAFGVEPRNLSGGLGPADRRRQINDAGRNLKLGIKRVEVLVVSHDILTDVSFKAAISAVNVPKVLIADEMHNLGSRSFIADPPNFFDYRLGLSATPIRQYDPEGTDRLFEFFGKPCFEFSLDQAIGVCLVPYDYYVHEVTLTADEMEKYSDLSDQIRSLAWKIQNGISDPQLDNLLRLRRLVLETAAGKLTALETLLDRSRPNELRYELVYATDKASEQLEAVNALLRARGILFHQLTAEETGNRKLTASILADYQAGGLQVLTAKRVLDEGVNVPQIKRAFILASNTVERQWVQRRGRILRRCDEIGKTFGVIHDFVAMPPPSFLGDDDAKNLARGELKRVHEFARLARNYAAPDGPIAAIERLQQFSYQI